MAFSFTEYLCFRNIWKENKIQNFLRKMNCSKSLTVLTVFKFYNWRCFIIELNCSQPNIFIIKTDYCKLLYEEDKLTSENETLRLLRFGSKKRVY